MEQKLSKVETLECHFLRMFLRRKPVILENCDSAYKASFNSSVEWLKRFRLGLNFSGKTVLDVGCGVGATCFLVAQNGTKRVVGVDINEECITFANSKLKSSQLKNQIAFYLLKDLPPAKYDLVLSKDSFEHYENPEYFINALKEHLNPDGVLLIGFSPLWKSPYGGHVQGLFWLPWVHLLFAEKIVMYELRRILRDESLTSYSKVASGLNKMTYERFFAIMKKSELKFAYIETNVCSEANRQQRSFAFFKLLASVPLFREYFTVNLHAIMKKDKQIKC